MSVYPRHTTLSPEERERVGTGARLTSHQCTVTYPDATNGTCHYERLGPRYHRFTFRYGDGTLVARIHSWDALEAARIPIEEACKARVEKAFAQAIVAERDDVFARATFPAGGGRDVDRNKATLSPDRAKQIGGKYGLCLRLPSGKLLCLSRVYDTVEEANARWNEQDDKTLVVACASRLDRRWMVPRFNPLHATVDFRKGVQNG